MDLSRSALFHMKTRVSLKYFVNDCKFQCKVIALFHMKLKMLL